MAFGWEAALACALGMLCVRFLGGLREERTRDWFIAALSSVVIAIWQPLALLVTVLLAAIAFLALRHGREDRLPRIPVAAAITLLVATLAVFKYVPGVSLLVPLGLSFTVFRLIGVVLDVNALRIPLPLSRFAALSLFFPTFPAGPITTVQSLKPLGDPKLEPLPPPWSEGAWRIVQGLARKLLLADPLYNLAIRPWIDAGIPNLQPYQSLVMPVLLGFYVYWDFAGYSDMAIGMAKLLGYEVPENFNRPYRSRSLIEFWRRWHITLSDWIRGRLMMKMSGRRPSAWRLHGATLASMALCGLWHGAGPGFLLWGLWHGLGLVGLHVFADAQRRSPRLRALVQQHVGEAASVVLTFAFVTVGWTVFFLSPADAATLLASALRWRGGSGPAIVVPGLVFVTLLLGYLVGDSLRPVWERTPPLLRACAQTVLAGVLTYALFLTTAGRQGFVYTQF